MTTQLLDQLKSAEGFLLWKILKEGRKLHLRRELSLCRRNLRRVNLGKPVVYYPLEIEEIGSNTVAVSEERVNEVS